VRFNFQDEIYVFKYSRSIAGFVQLKVWIAQSLCDCYNFG